MIKTTWVEESEERPSFAVIVQTLQSDVLVTQKETYTENKEDDNNYVDLSAQ